MELLVFLMVPDICSEPCSRWKQPSQPKHVPRPDRSMAQPLSS